MRLRARVSLPGLATLVAIAAAAAPPVQLVAQSLDEAVGRFVAAWGESDGNGLQRLMAESVRLELEGQEYLGIPPRQAAASLQRYLARFGASAPTVDRSGGTSGDASRGFAELSWSPPDPATGQPSSRAIFVGLRRSGEVWMVAEIRVLR